MKRIDDRKGQDRHFLYLGPMAASLCNSLSLLIHEVWVRHQNNTPYCLDTYNKSYIRAVIVWHKPWKGETKLQNLDLGKTYLAMLGKRACVLAVLATTKEAWMIHLSNLTTETLRACINTQQRLIMGESLTKQEQDSWKYLNLSDIGKARLEEVDPKTPEPKKKKKSKKVKEFY